MGETTSTWELPLHSSDSEHPEQKRREFHGKGRNTPASGDRTFPRTLGDLQHGGNASTVDTNPFDKRH